MTPTDTPAQVTKLAIEGGKPVRPYWLPYGKQSVDESDISAVANVLRGDWLTQGQNIVTFEGAVAKFCETKFAVAVSNGTAALHAAYFAAGIREGDEVVMPAMTFAATGNAALYLGATPVFADIEPTTGNISVDSARRAITKNTKALVGVDFSGQPCDLDALRTVADEHRIPLIIDGAHSLGARYKGRPAATVADLTTFSFHPVKSITTGEGGMVLTNSEKYAHAMRVFRTHGIEKEESRFENENQGPWYHEMQELGFNYRITDFQAALGTSQMKRLDEFLQRRREIAASYVASIAALKNIRCIEQYSDRQSAHHLFPILVPAEHRKFAVQALHAENIGVQIHYIPVYRHPFYQKRFAGKLPSCPNTDAFYEQIINLPIFPRMTNDDVRDVVEALQKLDAALAERA